MNGGLGAVALAVVAVAPAPPVRSELKDVRPVRVANFHSRLQWSNGGEPVQMRVWMTPEATLEETTRDGLVSFVLRRGTKLYTWLLGASSGMEGVGGGSGRLSSSPDTLEVLWALPADLAPERSQFRGSETIGGRRTLRFDFERRIPKIGQTVEGSVWILEDRLFPVRYVQRGFGGDFEILNTDIRLDIPIPDAYLEPPGNVAFRQFHTRAR